MQTVNGLWKAEKSPGKSVKLRINYLQHNVLNASIPLNHQNSEDLYAPPLDTEEAELQKITGFVLNYDSPEQCCNMQELNAYAKKMGYKKGWAYFQGKQRGFI